jgi:metal-responsive CopG/Arc/MetJ family transcriptional regulator
MSVAVNLSMHERVQKALDAMAERTGMTRSAFVEMLVREAAHRRELCALYELGCATPEHRSRPSKRGRS